MLVKIYEHDGQGNECYSHECDHSECFDCTDESYAALCELKASGRYWVGGGAAPLVLLMRAE